MAGSGAASFSQKPPSHFLSIIVSNRLGLIYSIMSEGEGSKRAKHTRENTKGDEEPTKSNATYHLYTFKRSPCASRICIALAYGFREKLNPSEQLPVLIIEQHAPSKKFVLTQTTAILAVSARQSTASESTRKGLDGHRYVLHATTAERKCYRSVPQVRRKEEVYNSTFVNGCWGWIRRLWYDHAMLQQEVRYWP